MQGVLKSRLLGMGGYSFGGSEDRYHLKRPSAIWNCVKERADPWVIPTGQLLLPDTIFLGSLGSIHGHPQGSSVRVMNFPRNLRTDTACVRALQFSTGSTAWLLPPASSPHLLWKASWGGSQKQCCHGLGKSQRVHTSPQPWALSEPICHPPQCNLDSSVSNKLHGILPNWHICNTPLCQQGREPQGEMCSSRMLKQHIWGWGRGSDGMSACQRCLEPWDGSSEPDGSHECPFTVPALGMWGQKDHALTPAWAT